MSLMAQLLAGALSSGEGLSCFYLFIYFFKE